LNIEQGYCPRVARAVLQRQGQPNETANPPFGVRKL
jgi:hypothetical protein